GLNLRPHPCEGCALPLSYAPTPSLAPPFRKAPGAAQRRSLLNARDPVQRLDAPTQAAQNQRATESLRPLPARNLGWVDSLICIGSPVRGLRPVEALRFEQEKVPKPTSRTSSPRFSADVIASYTPSTALDASPRLMPVVSATWPISSCLFISPNPCLRENRDSRLSSI